VLCLDSENLGVISQANMKTLRDEVIIRKEHYQLPFVLFMINARKSAAK